MHTNLSCPNFHSQQGYVGVAQYFLTQVDSTNELKFPRILAHLTHNGFCDAKYRNYLHPLFLPS